MLQYISRIMAIITLSRINYQLFQIKNMRAKTIFLCTFATVLSLFGCSKYDDAIESLEALETRVQALENRCREMNSQISLLSDLLDAVQKQKTITNVSQTSTGYVITFSDKQSIALNNGKDGSTPAVSVRQDSDGTWYWTLNGSWLLDGNGNKIPASAKDGITPLLKIENEYWYVSYNGGQSWKKLEKATGEDGDSFFKSVTQDDNYVYIVLIDNTTIKIQKENSLALLFSKTSFHPSLDEMTIPFTITSAGKDLKVVAFSDNNIAAKVYLDGGVSGHLDVKFIDGNHNGNILVAAKSNNKTATEILEFEDGVLATSSKTEYWVKTEGEMINVSLSRNTNIDIVSSATWIIVKPQTKSIIQENLQIDVAANDTYKNRVGEVAINGDEGLTLKFIIHQAQKDYIQLEKNALTILDDETVTLNYSTNITEDLTWISSNPEVATIGPNGLLTAVSRGKTTITLQTKDGKCSDHCVVTVKTFADGISVYSSSSAISMMNNLILYGSSITWVVHNNTGHTITVDSVYLLDGVDGSKSGKLDLNKELKSGSSASWGIGVPLRGIHYPFTAIFTVTCEGKTYTASGTYTYSRPF